MISVTDLEQQLREASQAYYNTGEAVMPDAEFDRLKEELQRLDPENAFLKEVGAPVTGIHLQKVKHSMPMGSLSNCTRDGDKANPSFADWHQKRNSAEVCVMHKLDGSSIELIYKNGMLVQAITRGDGFTGEDVTQNVFKFKNVPSKLKSDWSGCVRGEAMLLLSDFQKHFSDQANPRNAANGTVRRSDGTRAEHLVFYGFDVLGEFETQRRKLEFLEELGFEVVWFRVLTNVEDVLRVHEEQDNTRDSLPYEIDGLVIKVNGCALFDVFGERDNRPKGGVAFKFKAKETTTKLLGVKLSIGHTGAIIPTADLEPVEIGGVTVTSALMNNYDEIDRLGLFIGDEVTVIRSGDVIPKITGVANPGEERVAIVPPTKCTHCDSDLKKISVHWTCVNENCPGKQFRLLKTWVDKRNILYLGEKILEELYNYYGIRIPEQLYLLEENFLSKIEVGGSKVGSNAKRIMAQINKSKECPLHEFVGSLGIKFLGRRQAEIMIEQGVDTLKKFLTISVEELSKMDGFSETKATGIVTGLRKMASRMTALLENGVTVSKVEKKEPVSTDGKLSGKTFVFTGAIEKVGEDGKRFTRKMMWKVVEDNGGVASDKISKGVTHLVQADPSSQSSKTKKAAKLGVEVVSEAVFWKMVE